MDELRRRIEVAQQTGDLDLTGLGLSQIPSEVFLSGHPDKIRSLNLNGNRIRNFQIENPEALGGLVALSIARNGLEEVHASVCRLASLVNLNLSGNLMHSLPANLSQLTKLKELDLSGNPGFVPGREISGLRSLRRLSLRQNYLTELPHYLGYLPLDVQLDLEENFFDENVLALMERGNSNLFAYLRTMDAEPHYEAKLILLGEGNVGKTSIVEALRGNPFIEGRSATHGIKIETFEVDSSRLGIVNRFPGSHAGDLITVRSWDFGGQEVYRVTHQFFFTRHALYFVTWRPREGQEANFVDDWLRRIKLRCGDDARVLIVSTHAIEDGEEIDYPGLRQKYGPLLAGYHRVDTKDSFGIPELAERLAQMAASLPRMGERISARWRAVQDELLSRPDPYVKRATFDRICERYQVGEAEAEALAALLNDLGYIVYYPEDDDLRDLLILQPEWLTTAISCVLDDQEIKSSAGVLRHESLSRVWGDPRHSYPREIHPYFLRLMEKFDVSYRIQEETASLIAQLVPYERPELSWPTIGESDELVLLCDFSDEPTGLIPWLTVRTRRFAVSQWRKGFYLKHPHFDARALVESVSPTRLSVRVTGGSRAFLFDIVRDTVDQLVKLRWPGLSHQMRIPCPGDRSRGISCQASFRIESLERMRAEKIPKILCPDCVEWQYVDSLLVGISSNRGLDHELAIVSQIDSLQAEVVASRGELTRIITEAREFQENAGAAFHALLILGKAANLEVSDCPKLFSLRVADRSRFDPRRAYSSKMLLDLWCEETGSQHPVSPAYEFSYSKEWLVGVAPYLSFAAAAVGLLAPIVGGVAGAFDVSALKDSADLMKTLADSVKIEVSEGPEGRDGNNLSAAEGAALRSFREFLFELDGSRHFAGLQRLLTPTGEYQWLCPRHFAKYEPSIPKIYPELTADEPEVSDS
ncbi:hypothetical protein OG361_06430 [Streptomyces sp. NBC_00090]|uniref:COR domain-containing protein n=1 Tax=Streptomyces sp. NBC_00090 TaxID=2903619 RepID=UPI003252B2E9